MLSNGSESRHKKIYLNQTQTCFDDNKREQESLFYLYSTLLKSYLCPLRQFVHFSIFIFNIQYQLVCAGFKFDFIAHFGAHYVYIYRQTVPYFCKCSWFYTSRGSSHSKTYKIQQNTCRILCESPSQSGTQL